jgi:hypothetical protein
VTLASFAIVPVLWAVTTIWTVALSSSASVPSAHVTVPLASAHVPCEGVAESKVTSVGSVSVSSTPVALWGPEFWTVRS